MTGRQIVFMQKRDLCIKAEVPFSYYFSPQGVLHVLRIRADVLGRVLTVLGEELDDGGADDRAVGEVGHLLRLLGRGDAKADGAGNVRTLLHKGNDGGEVGLDLAALARDAERRDNVEEALGLACDHRDAVF